VGIKVHIDWRICRVRMHLVIGRGVLILRMERG
jgi:hypothetical protein